MPSLHRPRCPGARSGSPRGALLLAQARQRRLPVQQRPEGRPVGVDLQKPGIFQGGIHRPGIVQLDEPVGIVGEYGGPGADQRALATQFIVDVVPGQQARDQPLRLRVALADGKRPGGGKQQPRPGLELGARG